MLYAARAAGAEVCFANPGTTEMPLVAALDEVSGIRAVLGLFEGVCTGAADGYGRMANKPALTLLHLGPGFANGIANLHNARRARTPIVNIIGDHASWHLPYDAPLTSDIHSLARPVSAWVKTIAGSSTIESDTREAFNKAMALPHGISTLVFPVDFQQATLLAEVGEGMAPSLESKVSPERVSAVAVAMRRGLKTVFLLGGCALSEEGQLAAGRIAAATGAQLFSETFPARSERGGGLPDIDRLPYFPEVAIAALEGATVVLVGAIAPVAYFGYEGLPSELAPQSSLITLAQPGEAADQALEALADLLDAPRVASGVTPSTYELEDGPLTPVAVGRTLSNALPDNAIVSVEGGTCGYPFVTASAAARRHTVLTNTGGAIGQGLPVALGAAIACPERRVFALQSDGSAQYTIQSLWTMARERLPVIMLITSNKRYGILQTELSRIGLAQIGPEAQRLTVLDDPAFDWLALAKGYGVAAQRVSTIHQLRDALALAADIKDSPYLIEMCLP